MCGIQVAESNTYVVAPKIGGNITHASCEYNGIYGKVKSEWQRDCGRITCRITVPANVTVKAILSDGEHICGAGVHEFTVLK
jgi:alpha-L-rhamnosidase